MKNKIIIISVLISTLFGCSSLDYETDPILKNNPKTLATSHHQNNSNIKWVGCYGYALYLPGVPDEIKWELENNNIHIIAGTSDDISGRKDANYNGKAFLFAEKYNTQRMKLDKQ